MLNTFVATLTPVCTLFLFMVIGFALKKTDSIPGSSNSVMAKLETWVFAPALSFMSMASYFTVDSLELHASNIVFAIITVSLSLTIAIPLSCLFVKNKTYERYVYQYGLAFANCGYMADPLVDAMFPGTNALAYYKIFC